MRQRVVLLLPRPNATNWITQAISTHDDDPPNCTNFPFLISIFRSTALLRLRRESILSLLTEDSHANRCGREVVHRWNHRRDYFLRFFFYCGERAAARPAGRPAV